MLGEMMRLAMHGHGAFGPHPVIHLRHLAAARMARAMHEMIVVGDHLDAEIAKIVDDAMHLARIAGNGARGEDHAVARVDLDRMDDR